ncbi:CidA/LrgA family protein [Trinickia violacea]|uniref:CidA/LrgA family protein n=1 Tax=Trinickia violacea TaxID=2571746 RepID=A0A4P8IZN4_9BURK|nr:CidA/LrgA family protein [Trinickia violacea]QCP51419.1 CidA/LrgA family protein [Trinickia violacea]
MTIRRSNSLAATRLGSIAMRVGKIALQTAAIAAVWSVADFVVRRTGLPVSGGVLGLGLLLVLLFGGVATRWVEDGANWLLSDMLLFFIPATIAAVKYGGLFEQDGWRLALVIVAGTVSVMVAVACAVDMAARFERRLALQRVRVARSARRAAWMERA